MRLTRETEEAVRQRIERLSVDRMSVEQLSQNVLQNERG